MNKIPATKFLQDYTKITTPLLKKYLDLKIKETKEIGNIPTEALKCFSEMALLGKRIRGALIVLGYQIGGGKDIEAIYDTSLFYELFQTGILVQDDVIDNSDKRRGLPALHKQYQKMTKASDSSKFGESTANCVGDFAFFIAYEKLLLSPFPGENKLQAAAIFSRYAARLTMGQILDVANSNNKNASEQEVMQVMKIKTAEYTGAAPLLIGAALAGEKNQAKLEALRQYGLSLGWALQIQDDILGIFGEEKVTGKPVGSDLAEGKMTLLVIHLLRYGKPKQKIYLKNILGKKDITDDEVKSVRDMFRESGSYNYAKKQLQDYLDCGIKQINMITSDLDWQKLLTSFLQFMAERMF